MGAGRGEGTLRLFGYGRQVKCMAAGLAEAVALSRKMRSSMRLFVGDFDLVIAFEGFGAF